MYCYYAVFFTPVIKEKLRTMVNIQNKYDLISAGMDWLHDRELGEPVVQGMVELSVKIGFPTCLQEVPSYTQENIALCLFAAKNPQLDMKLWHLSVIGALLSR